ncbi:MAG: FG-GAP-like repeat-containing protein [Nocardioides sp.]|uniref:FG-GAP-like repeat-containing protein n=1 Tax=Nocardioides sp. TaxID=35761 RepID=UPI003F06F1F6
MHFLKPAQARLVTLCQQLLVVAVVAALLAPASGVLTLDVVREHPTAGASAALVSATVPTDDVEAEVTEVPLTAAADAGEGEGTTLGRRAAGLTAAPATEVVSDPEPVEGFGAVGITWEAGQEYSEDAIALKVRTRTGDEWSDWTELEYHDEHAPDPTSSEAATARPGTEPVFVGDVDDVQVSVETTDETLPSDLSLALVEPGVADDVETETPAYEGETPTAVEGSDEGAAEATDGIVLQAKKTTPAKPTIFSRAQWGADESIRNKKSLTYGTISGGFVHHTVNANDYTEAQVPGIIRSIYAYHVKSRGWSDIGYNFLVDRFGRIWEGRYGGVDKAVVGAHTLNYNQYSFAMSAIGNYETAQPSDVMLKAYGQLFAWKLSLHGVDPASTRQKIGSKYFQAINGHRDAGSTACPGKYLYAKLPTIRKYASEGTTTGPTPVKVGTGKLSSNLAGSAYPDLIVRSSATKRAYVIPTEGLTSFGTRKVAHASAGAGVSDFFMSPDLTGDGIVDGVSVDSAGVATIRAGSASGTLGDVTKSVSQTSGHTQLAAAGDLNGDGRNDLVGRKGKQLVVFLQTAKRRYKIVAGPTGLSSATRIVGPGDLTGDGLADLLVRTTSGSLVLYPGNGKGGFSTSRTVTGNWTQYSDLAGGGDYTGDGRNDLVAKNTAGQIWVLPGNGDGTFATPLGPTATARYIRTLSAAGNVTGTSAPDIVGLRGNKVVTMVNRGTRELGTPIDTGISVKGMNLLLNVGDLNRDGKGDFLVRGAGGRLRLYAGKGTGKFTDGGIVAEGLKAVTNLRAVGDVTSDGIPDLMGTDAAGATTLWAGTSQGKFAAPVAVQGRVPVAGGLPSDTSRFDTVLAIQDLRLGSLYDHVARDRATGDLYLFNGTTGAAAPARPLGNLKGYDRLG